MNGNDHRFGLHPFHKLLFRGMRQLMDALHQAHLVLEVEVRGGLIQQQQRRLLRQRACQEKPLLLSPREL